MNFFEWLALLTGPNSASRWPRWIFIIEPLPRKASLDVKNLRRFDAVLSSNINQTSRVFTDGFYVHLLKAGGPFFTAVRATLLRHVSVVLGDCAKKQMVDINAQAIVAAMADEQCSGSNFTVREAIGESVNARCSAIFRHAVAGRFIDTAGPVDASIWSRRRLGAESFTQKFYPHRRQWTFLVGVLRHVVKNRARRMQKQQEAYVAL